jgi:hypothetical protein
LGDLFPWINLKVQGDPKIGLRKLVATRETILLISLGMRKPEECQRGIREKFENQ